MKKNRKKNDKMTKIQAITHKQRDLQINNIMPIFNCLTRSDLRTTCRKPGSRTEYTILRIGVCSNNEVEG